MFNLAVFLQVLVTIICFASVLVMATKKTSSYSNLIIITFICGFIQNGAYILELLAKNVDQGMVAVRAEYLGGAFEIGLMTVFIFKYCGHEFNNLIKGLLVFEGAFVLFGVWTWEFNGIYYTDASFVSNATIPHLVLSHGWLYFLFAFTTVCELISCAFILVVSILKTNQKHMKYNYIVLLFVVLTPFLGFVLSVSGLLSGYDSTPIGAGMAIGLFAFAIARNHVFDVADAAGEYILSTLENAIIIINSDEGYEYSNIRAKELFPVLNGYTRGNVIKDTEIKNLFDKRRSDQIIIGDRSFEVNLNKVTSGEQEIGQTAVLFDVTESKKQIEQMKELMLSAKEANDSKSEFLASVSHEIRTPINVVMGMSEVMLRDHCTPETEQYLVNINNSSNTLLNLINDILDYAKIDAGKLEIIDGRFDLKKFLSEVVSIYEFRCEQKGIKFSYEIASDIPRYVMGDIARIRQIITNILSNAVMNTENGSIKLKLSYKFRSDIDVDLIIAIEDTGVGVKREDYDKIFDGLVRIEQKGSYAQEGTGLELSITKQLVELLGGIINFRSDVNKGSVFSLVIPVKIASDGGDIVEEEIGAISKEKVFKAEYTAPKARILVVDDSRINIMVTKALLKEVKCEIVSASSGEECLDMVGREHFDIVMLDHRMPGMDGLETFSRMKMIEGTEKIAVIMHTANASSDARAFYLSKGFTDFLTKPTTEEQIVSILYKYLPEELIEKK